jgi:hypothetical protein
LRLKRWLILAVLGCSACHNPTVADRSASVSFVLVAPLCSSVLPAEFFIDSRFVGVDTFRVAVDRPRIVSRSFAVSPGPHTLDARVVGGYVWPTHTVQVPSGSSYADSLAFYCS